MTIPEEALAPEARVVDDQVIRLDLVEKGPPAPLRDALARTGARSKRGRALVSIAVGEAITDACSLGLAIVLAGLIAPKPGGEAPVGVLVMSAAVLVWLAVFGAYGLYRPLHLAAHEEFRRLLGASSLAGLLVAAGILATEPTANRSLSFWVWLFALPLELVTRTAWRRFQDRLRQSGRLGLRTLVVGSNDEANQLAEQLGVDGSGYVLLGQVGQASTNGLPLVGGIEDLRTAVRALSTECLFVASTALDLTEGALVAQVARQERVKLCYSANLPPTLASRLEFQQFGPSVALSVSPAGLTGVRAGAKRTMDVILSTLALTIGLPILAVVAVAIRLTSRGPVLYRQQRVTRGGRTFTMYKFRTMRTDADEVMRDLAMESTQPFFKVPSDPRLTAVGRLIRRLSLDELPQVYNVLRGDMSVVGPRPLPAEQVASNLDLLSSRHEVRAGLTGWWQIKGRSDLTPEESVRLDQFYIENWSPALDLYIMAKTVGVVLSRRGAY
jgi:exopolysaccharide biosynthesis polyprenyl glycosylphosphotransferase